MRVIYAVVLALIFASSFQGSSSAGELDKGRAAVEAGDYQTAYKLLRPLADAGDADAQIELGSMYMHGKGIWKDYVQAYKWFMIGSQGKSGAESDIYANMAAMAAVLMTRAEIEEARFLVTTWKPHPVSRKKTKKTKAADK